MQLLASTLAHKIYGTRKDGAVAIFAVTSKAWLLAPPNIGALIIGALITEEFHAPRKAASCVIVDRLCKELFRDATRPTI